jgi:hypothetical protein
MYASLITRVLQKGTLGNYVSTPDSDEAFFVALQGLPDETKKPQPYKGELQGEKHVHESRFNEEATFQTELGSFSTREKRIVSKFDNIIQKYEASEKELDWNFASSDTSDLPFEYQELSNIIDYKANLDTSIEKTAFEMAMNNSLQSGFAEKTGIRSSLVVTTEIDSEERQQSIKSTVSTSRPIDPLLFDEISIDTNGSEEFFSVPSHISNGLDADKLAIAENRENGKFLDSLPLVGQKLSGRVDIVEQEQIKFRNPKRACENEIVLSSLQHKDKSNLNSLKAIDETAKNSVSVIKERVRSLQKSESEVSLQKPDEGGRYLVVSNAGRIGAGMENDSVAAGEQLAVGKEFVNVSPREPMPHSIGVTVLKGGLENDPVDVSGVRTVNSTADISETAMPAASTPEASNEYDRKPVRERLHAEPGHFIGRESRFSVGEQGAEAVPNTINSASAPKNSQPNNRFSGFLPGHTPSLEGAIGSESVDITVTEAADTLDIRFGAKSGDTFDLLARYQSELRNDLRRAGIDEYTLGFDKQGERASRMLHPDTENAGEEISFVETNPHQTPHDPQLRTDGLDLRL